MCKYNMSVTPDPLTLQLQKAIRESALSMNFLAHKCGIDDSQLSRFMRNERTLTLPVAAKLCAVLGLELKRKENEKRK